MAKRKSTEKQIKRRSITILIILVVVLGVYLYVINSKKSMNFIEKQIDNILNKPEENVEKEEEKPVVDPYKDYKEQTIPFELELNSADRYIAYKEKNPNMDYATVVTYVNIGLDKEYYSYISDASLNKGILVLMNKYLKLPDNYEPSDLETISSTYFISGNAGVRKLRKEAKQAFEKLSADAIKNGTPVYGQSAYRSFSRQKSLYDRAVNNYGVKQADSDTARPGHSEHQTGLAIDVSSTKGGNMGSFGNTKSYTWMQNNAHKYGFIMRYPKNQTNITGFIYESWHYRYVGIDVATDMHDNHSDLTYDEYYYRYIEKED